MSPLDVTGALGACQPAVDAALAEMTRDDILPRIWTLEHTVWKPEPKEIVNRLGWLRIAEAMTKEVPRLEALAKAAREAGYTQALVLGMGGSSLAPEVFRNVFGVAAGGLDLAVLDSTDPGAVLAHARGLDPARTLFIVSAKSGDTVETFSFFKYFYNWVLAANVPDGPGAHFIAITDPGSKLADLAREYDFRAAFLNDPNIGGRFSALSFFGLAPAALVGLNLRRLLGAALSMAAACGPDVPPAENPGARLGAVLGELARAGRDKLTLVASPRLANFADWVEQLIAESTGKEGRGILPVVGEPLAGPEVYSDDRVFAYVRVEGDTAHDAAVQAVAFEGLMPLRARRGVEDAGHPVARLTMSDLYDLGAQIFLWELATVVAGCRLGINPFDQPNVQLAKTRAAAMVDAYRREGALPALEPALEADGITVYAPDSPGSPRAALDELLAAAQPGAYIALHAYLPPTPATELALTALRLRLRDRTRLATTAGYGPRFLHSTGQLHKGDAGRGLFIQLTADHLEDVPIPDTAGKSDSAITFGVLEQAQALGDRQALLDRGRRVIRFHLGSDISGGLRRLCEIAGQ